MFEAEPFGRCLSFKSLNIHFYKSNIFIYSIYSYYWLSLCYFYTHWDMTRLIRVSGPKPNVNKVSEGSCKTYPVWILWNSLERRFTLLWNGKLLCFYLLMSPYKLCRSNSQDMMKRINRQNSRMICLKSDISMRAKREYKETQPEPYILIGELQKTEMQWHEALWGLENSLQQTCKTT